MSFMLTNCLFVEILLLSHVLTWHLVGCHTSMVTYSALLHLFLEEHQKNHQINNMETSQIPIKIASFKLNMIFSQIFFYQILLSGVMNE